VLHTYTLNSIFSVALAPFHSACISLSGSRLVVTLEDSYKKQVVIYYLEEERGDVKYSGTGPSERVLCVLLLGGSALGCITSSACQG
jgi:hypothetical protein